MVYIKQSNKFLIFMALTSGIQTVGRYQYGHIVKMYLWIFENTFLNSKITVIKAKRIVYMHMKPSTLIVKFMPFGQGLRLYGRTNIAIELNWFNITNIFFSTLIYSSEKLNAWLKYR